MTTQTPRRADAQRNVQRILDAAISCLALRPNATMAEIAQVAGLGRVTLYGHFSSRTQLLDAVVAHLIDVGEESLSEVDLEGDAWDALVRLIRSSWRLVDQARAVVAAAEGELPPARMRQLHDGPAARVEALIDRGRRSGTFRTDLPTWWLVAMLHQILHGAGAEVSAGRLPGGDAPDYITATVHALLRPPA